MARISNPHIDVDGGIDGLSWPAGKLPGCLHSSHPDEGLTWQCVLCELVTTYTWEEIDDTCDFYLKAHGDGELSSIPLPPCPSCGGVACVNYHDVELGLDEPHHYTQRALREHLLVRPRVKGRFVLNPHHGVPSGFQGRDFSHLPAKRRPAHHEKLGPEHTGLRSH